MLLSAVAMLPAWGAQVYTVGVEEVDYYPIFSVSPPNGAYRGYARDVLDRFAAYAHIRFVYQPLPVRRLYREYWGGNVDLVFPDNPRWDAETKRQLTIRYSQPVLTFQDAMLVRPERKGMGIERLRRLGFVRGFTPWKFQADIEAGRVSIDEAPGPESLIRMTLAGHIDGANMAQQVARYHLTRMGQPDGLVVDPSLLEIRDSHYHLSSIRHPELIRRFDAFLRKDASALAELRARYGL